MNGLAAIQMWEYDPVNQPNDGKRNQSKDRVQENPVKP
jgi:hypothetical protein